MLRWGVLSVVTLAFVVLVSRLSYKEDISDFLPLDTSDREALSIYQDISGADNAVIIFENPGSPQLVADAIETFYNYVVRHDTLVIKNRIMVKFDVDELAKITDFVYGNIPYFLTESDYNRIDSLLQNPQYVRQQLKEDKEMLMFPSGGLLAQNISRDPLNLFTPVVSRMSKSQTQSHFETYDGYIFSPDMKRAFVLVSSPYGNSETENNTKFISLLEKGIANMQRNFPKVKAHVTSGPQIAVGNANQIKKDSILAVSISIVLIALLLWYSFRSVRNISLIGVSICWGWLFALACISLIHDSISIIVIGISSIIIGIAVNYPLHLIDHLNHEPEIKRSLREIVSPLVVGNITTIGAFLALVPLKSIALRDLGMFASLLLLGTILFVLIFLPHMTRRRQQGGGSPMIFRRVASANIEDKRWLLYVVIFLTAIFAWYSFGTEFDANMSNINYMTEEQREDMDYFQHILASDKNAKTDPLYVVSSASSMDKALEMCQGKQRQLDSLKRKGRISSSESAITSISSLKEQQKRIDRWNSMKKRYASVLCSKLPSMALAEGFSTEAFSIFYDILDTEYKPQQFAYFALITNTVFKGNFSIDLNQNRYSVIDKVYVKADEVSQVKNLFPGSFDVKSMNSAIANSLSDDFNYIGFACSAIVFFFLWFSFGRIELALIAFLPMAISWIWILGLMGVLGIKFNIVNVILATFIFGQGDDYTIFITEGCQYEYAYRRSMLASYKNSIILSALIMFVGIGSLIVAKHPAMFSLAEITIIGMFSVVLMAYLIPPLVFNWMIKSRGRYRKRPLTIGAIARSWYSGAIWLAQLSVGYALGFILFSLCGRNKRTKSIFHKIVTSVHRLDLRIFPGVRNRILNPGNENFSKPCVIICNHQSMLDPMYLMALSPKIIIVANQHSSLNPIIRLMFRWLDFYTIVEDGFERDIPLLERYINEGYSIAIYAEGERNPASSILRFHKGAFMLASRLSLDVLPIYLHGLNNVMPIRSFAANPGLVTMIIGERITPAHPLWNRDYPEMTRNIHRFFISEYEKIKRRYETSAYFSLLVKERYLYKGEGIVRKINKALSQENLAWVDSLGADSNVLIENCGCGSLALLTAMVYPEKKVYACEANADYMLLAKYSAKGLAKNLQVISDTSTIQLTEGNSIIYKKE